MIRGGTVSWGVQLAGMMPVPLKNAPPWGRTMAALEAGGGGPESPRARATYFSFNVTGPSRPLAGSPR